MSKLYDRMTDVQDFSPISPITESSPPERPRHIAFRTDPTFDNDEAVDDTPENYVLEHYGDHVMRPRAMSHHLSSTKVPSRRWLTVQANFWRACMKLGMRFHNYPTPRPPKPAFIHKIPTDTIPIELYFYVPPSYYSTCRTKPDHRYPVVVNFHGGGFCLGHATDDRYYARIILAHTSAIFVSVNYRRAPEHPFPIPVDDSVEALLYLTIHADKYHIDPSKIALTGFSAGANLSLTVPFRLAFHTDHLNPRKFPNPESVPPSEPSTPNISRMNTRTEVPIPEIIMTTTSNDSNDRPFDCVAERSSDHGLDQPTDSTAHLLTRPRTNTNSSRPYFRKAATHAAGSDWNLSTTGSHFSNLTPTTSNIQIPHDMTSAAPTRPQLITAQSTSRITRLLTPTTVPTIFRPNPSPPSTAPPSRRSSSPKSDYHNLKVLSIVAWYPLLDWTASRSSKRRSSVNPNKTLNPLFTNLFDMSYLPPPDHEGRHVSPYASPGLAPDEMLSKGLPRRIQLWLCEYDMLLKEGKQFSNRLDRLGKDIETTLIEGVPHGWDKSPNPFRDQSKIDKLYIQAAQRLEEVFEEARREPGSVAGERIGLGGRR